MNSEDLNRIKGLTRLIRDAVDGGATFVETHHRHAAAKPFRVLESIKPIAGPTVVVRSVHDGVLSLTYGSIRGINRAAGIVADWAVGRLTKTDL